MIDVQTIRVDYNRSTVYSVSLDRPYLRYLALFSNLNDAENLADQTNQALISDCKSCRALVNTHAPKSLMSPQGSEQIYFAKGDYILQVAGRDKAGEASQSTEEIFDGELMLEPELEPGSKAAMLAEQDVLMLGENLPLMLPEAKK